MKRRSKASKVTLMVSSITALSMMLAACGGGGSTTSPSPSPSANTASPSPDGGKTEDDVYPENGLSKTEEVTLKVGFWESGYGRDYYDFAVKKFTERYPNVKFDTTYSATLDKILEPRIAAQNDNEMFDIFYPMFSGADVWNELRLGGKIEELDDLWERDLIGEEGKTLRSVIPDSAYNNVVRFDGKTYQIPLGSYTAGFFYNDNLFTEKGWNKNPKTYDEFVELLETIKQDGLIPITFPGIYPEYLTGFAFDLIKFSRADAEGKFAEFEKAFGEYQLPDYTHEYAIDEFTRIYELGKKGYFPNGVAALNHTQSQMQVLQGKAAMVASGDWIGNEMKEATPEGFKWGFMGLPATSNPNDKIYVQSASSTSSMVIWKARPDLNKKWAKEFMLFQLDFDVMSEMAKASIFPSRIDFGDDPKRIEALDEVPAAVARYAQENNVVLYAPTRVVTLTSPALAAATKLMQENVPGIASGQVDPLPILEKADENIKKALDEQ